MFKNEYQGGPVVDIFSAQGKDPMAKWKVFGSQAAIWKEFDKEVKSFVYVLEGSSQTNKMQMPKDSKMALGLTQRYLILQMYVPLGNDFTTELMITDLGNLKRRLYLSTVHKEVSATPLHAKIPLSCLKRSIWCNVCIDLVSFTSEIFKGAAFLSLDGIIISATCRLRKIFTMKLQPQGLLDDEECGPTDIIPRICQLPADVQHVTQLINMNTLRMAEMKLIGCSLSSETAEQASSTRTASARNNKNQDISHIAFGSKVLGPPPATGRRIITTGSRESTQSTYVKTQKICNLPQEGTNMDVKVAEHCIFMADKIFENGNKFQLAHSFSYTPLISETVPHHVIQPHLPQDQSRERASRGRLQAQSAGGNVSHKYNNQSSFNSKPSEELVIFFSKVFRGHIHIVQTSSQELPLFTKPDKCLFSIHLESSFVSTKSTSQVPVHSQPHRSRVQHQLDCGDTEGSNEDEETEPQLCQVGIFTYSSRPHSAQKHRRSQSTPVKNFPFILDEKGDNNLGHRGARLEDDFLGSSSEEEYDLRNLQPTRMSSWECHMLASLWRQQNKELEEEGRSPGLSASQIDNCNVSISTSSDDTTTWNSCQPLPVNQGHHYQKEMNPLLHSNP
uniref:CFAP20 domain containing n=1 Tax=Lepisosteus oculatus TaxID=7918 RepID=W5MWS1_LEPOC